MCDRQPASNDKRAPMFAGLRTIRPVERQLSVAQRSVGNGRRSAVADAWLVTVSRWLALVLLLVLTACTPFRSVQSSPPSGTLRWSIEGVTDLPDLDPAKSSNQQSVTVISLVFAGLVRLDGDLEIQPDGAERWQVSSDGRVYTFTIRENLKFGDGTLVTAEDFRYSINRALAPETASYGAPAQLSHIVGAVDVIQGRAQMASGVRVLDERTLQIELDEPQAFFLAQLAYPYTFAVPRALIEREGAHWIEHAFGTGPFRVREWLHNQEIVLEANPYYWRGTPGVASVRFPFYSDSELAYQAYQQGDLDIMGNSQSGVPASRVADVQNLPDFRTSPALTVRYVGFNNRRAPFNNVYVRQALALAVDKRVLAQQVLSNTVVATDRILPQGLAGSQLPVESPSFDPVDARAALGLAGYPGGQGLPLITLTYGEEGDNALVAQALRRFWRNTLGVDVQLEGLVLEQFIERLDETYRDPENGLQMYLSVWGADYPDPQNFLSQQLRTASPNNNGHWSNPEFDRLVDQADRMGAQNQYEQRLQLYSQAEQIALSEVGWLPLYNPRINVLMRPTVNGLVFTPQGIVAPDWTQVRMVEATQ